MEKSEVIQHMALFIEEHWEAFTDHLEEHNEAFDEDYLGEIIDELKE